MNEEMRYFERVHDINELDPHKAEARVKLIEDQFADLLQYVNEQRDEKEDETSPTPSPSPSPSPSLSASPSSTATRVPSPSAVSPWSPVFV